MKQLGVKVSILIPNYNKAPYLRETLASVLAQTYYNWECIIVDDHSTDNSWDILKEFADKDFRFRIFKRPNDWLKGGNNCRNYAFEQARGEFINWFDSDDLMVNIMLENRIFEMHNNFQADFGVFSGSNFFKKLEDGDRVFSWVFHQNHLMESFLSLDPPWFTPSCLYKKKFLVDRQLSWNSELTILQDVIYDLKAFTKSVNIHFSKSPIDWYWRWHMDGHNVGAKRSDPYALNSYNLVFKEFHKITSRVNKQLNEFISSAAYELCLAARDNYSSEFYKNIVWVLYQINVFSFQVFVKHSMYFLVYKLGSMFGERLKLKLKKRAMTSVLSNLNSKRFKERLTKPTDLISFNQLISNL